MSQMLSTKEAAAEIGTDARTLRKFIRSDSCSFDAVGQGKRYEFSKKDVNQLKKAFLAWSGGAPSKKKVNGTKLVVQATDDGEIIAAEFTKDDYDGTTAEVIDDPDADVDEDEIAFLEGPSDEDLEDIDNIEIEDIDLD